MQWGPCVLPMRCAVRSIKRLTNFRGVWCARCGPCVQVAKDGSLVAEYPEKKKPSTGRFPRNARPDPSSDITDYTEDDGIGFPVKV